MNYKARWLMVTVCAAAVMLTACANTPFGDAFENGYSGTRHMVRNMKDVPVSVYTGRSDIILKPLELEYLGPVSCKDYIHICWVGKDGTAESRNMRVNCKGVTIIK